MPNPQPGTILGAYRVEGTIGSGSMGDVFKAIDTGLNRRVAIKILSEKHKDSQELRARFIREGRAVAAISHPNVVQVFATGSFDDRPYIAMELLDGTDLGSIIEKQGPLDNASAAHVMLDSAQGLAAAAKAGLIHRDVKPSNLVRLTDGRVKVTDFGLAKPVDPGGEPALTAMGVVVGTPDYIAPEQARGEKIDEHVDIYALGGTLYFLLTGVPPFRTGKPAEDKYLKVVARHLRNPPPDAAVTRPAADRELADLARQMMAKKVPERPGYPALIQQLTGIMQRLDPGAVPELIVAARDRSRPNTAPNLRPEGVGASLDDSVTISQGSMPPVRAIPGWVIAFSVLCAGVFAAGLVVYLRRSEAATAPPLVGPGVTTRADAGVATPSSDAPGPLRDAGRGSAAKPGDPGSAAPPPDAAAADPALAPPTGMLLVKHGDGSPWLFVDAEPVSAATYHLVFTKHDQAGNPDAPVTDVSYDEARSFARTRGGRLLRSDEWDAAAVTAGFVVRDGIFEWVESFDTKKTVRQHGKTLTRADVAQKDITFRIAKDLAP